MVASETPPRQLTRHGADRKAELLHHAEALFAERGYADTRMIDIAGAAGVAKGLFYWYFDSKEALFREIIADLRERLREAQRDAVVGLRDPLAMLYVGTVVSVRFVAEHHRLYGLIAQVRAADPTFTNASSSSIQVHARDAAGLLEEGQRVGVVRGDDDPLGLAFANTGVVTQLVLQLAAGALPGSVDDAAHLAARYVVRAVAVDEALADAAEREGRARV